MAIHRNLLLAIISDYTDDEEKKNEFVNYYIRKKHSIFDAPKVLDSFLKEWPVIKFNKKLQNTINE